MKLFLSSHDYEDFSTPLEIVDYKTSIISNRNCLVITTSNKLPYSEEYKGKKLNKFILVGRHSEKNIVELTKFPMSVHVIEYLDEDIELSDRYNFAWAFLYDNLKDAKEENIPNGNFY